jgi:hypothetical protein
MVIHFLPEGKRQDLKKNGVLERKLGRNKVCGVPSPRSSFFLRSEDVINRTEAGMTWMEKRKIFPPHIYSFASLGGRRA